MQNKDLSEISDIGLLQSTQRFYISPHFLLSSMLLGAEIDRVSKFT
ncbi:hypothetical protein THOB06_80006 [Vibrio rotiferianus]|nr:hypothetical protein THOG10_80006 [Vibrio rotiferianus]CAH1595518.1 hypothetical protein THOB06_80006 [Vibrio rotiferianus]